MEALPSIHHIQQRRGGEGREGEERTCQLYVPSMNHITIRLIGNTIRRGRAWGIGMEGRERDSRKEMRVERRWRVGGGER
jgi:hypothetical protein